MKHFISISRFPGSMGTYFYNSFFKKYELNCSYSAERVFNLTNFMKILSVNNLGGMSVSMPFKKEIIKYLSCADKSVLDYNSCNTVVIKDGELVGHNTDYQGVLFIKTLISPKDQILLLGSGAMGNMIYKEFLPFNSISMVSRSLSNWETRHILEPSVIINATGAGTNSPASPMLFIPDSTKLVIDLAIKDNQLKQQCLLKNIKYIGGFDFYKHQFKKQFKIYTDIDIELSEIDEIAEQM